MLPVSWKENFFFLFQEELQSIYFIKLEKYYCNRNGSSRNKISSNTMQKIFNETKCISNSIKEKKAIRKYIIGKQYSLESLEIGFWILEGCFNTFFIFQFYFQILLLLLNSVWTLYRNKILTTIIFTLLTVNLLLHISQ